MCRNIKTLANFAPPATDDEIRASALQFVRKLSGATHPSHANEAAFDAAVNDVTVAETNGGTTLATFTVTRTQGTDGTVTVATGLSAWTSIGASTTVSAAVHGSSSPRRAASAGAR